MAGDLPPGCAARTTLLYISTPKLLVSSTNLVTDLLYRSMAFASSTTIKTPRPEKAVAVACLQAQHVAGLPAAAEGRHVLLHLVQQQQVETTAEALAAAAARCTGGVAAFHDQVILLHCAPAHAPAAVDVAVTVSPRSDHRDSHTTATLGVPDDHRRQRVAAPSTAAATVRVDLAEQLRRPSPSVLTFVLGGGGATAGAVLSLTLHHRLIARSNRRHSCCLPRPPAPPLPDLRLNCLRMRMPPDTPPRARKEDDDGDHGSSSSSSSGFITIEKGTISRRRPPSDNLLATADDEGEGKPGKPPTTVTTTALAEEELDVDSSKVVAEFLAILEEADRRCCYDGGDLDLETLVEDAEAELAAVDRRS
ncbi:hypothetical protein ACP4OV_013589 [Aristida adscensionis]